MTTSPERGETGGGALRAVFARLDGDRALNLFLAAGILLIGLAYFYAAPLRHMDNDEFEHLHKAWLMMTGRVPVIGPSLHTPLLQWVIVPFMRLTGETPQIARVMRLVMFGFMAGSLSLVYGVARRIYGDALTARLAVILLAANLVWVNKAFEIRPDVPMVFFALAALRLLVAYHERPSWPKLAALGLCAALAFLGKQNAVVFFLPAVIVFTADAVFRRRIVPLWVVPAALALAAVLAQIEPFRHWFDTGMQYVVTKSGYFSPIQPFGRAWRFNRVLFLLFILQLPAPLRLAEGMGIFRVYLLSIVAVSIAVLFAISRPFMQEMLVLVACMSIVAANLLAVILRSVDWRARYLIALFVIAPALVSVPHTARRVTNERALETTRAVLAMTAPDDLVFDAYGRAIFRPHPLDPSFLVYRPARFRRLDQLKACGLRFAIRDHNYFPRLPKETLAWFDENFEPSPENPDILVRRRGSP